MILRDWRDADAALLRGCYAAEQRSWRDDLAWETAWTWSTIERARTGWGLPGLLAFEDDGTFAGWTFYIADGDTLHVGGLFSSSPAATAALLGDILAGPAAESNATACFIRDRAPGIGDALAGAHFEVERFLYLSRPLVVPSPGGAAGSAVAAAPDVVSGDKRSAPADVVCGCGRVPTGGPRTRAWQASDLAAAAALFQASYTSELGRHFAPHGTAGEWIRYVTGIVEQRACGTLDAASTRVVGEGRLDAVAMVTTLAPRTAHLAQFAVHPEVRGRGVGSALLDEVVAGAARAGKEALTLLVSERNAAARGLYASMGFVECGIFVAARREMAPSPGRPGAGTSSLLAR